MMLAFNIDLRGWAAVIVALATLLTAVGIPTFIQRRSNQTTQAVTSSAVDLKQNQDVSAKWIVEVVRKELNTGNNHSAGEAIGRIEQTLAAHDHNLMELRRAIDDLSKSNQATDRRIADIAIRVMEEQSNHDA